MKEQYITPEMDIVLFECEDVITASGIAANSTYNMLQMMNAGYIDTIDDSQWS